MKIALFYPRNTYASWYALGGYRTALTDLGHEVVDCPLPGNNVEDVDNVRKKLPTINMLNTCDCVLVAFAEYVRPWLEALYGKISWVNLVKVPKINRYDESFCRADIKHLLQWDELKQWADFHSFSTVQDAERFGGQFLPYGADTDIFKPSAETAKIFDLGFIGMMYSVRTQYAKLLNNHLRGITFWGGPVMVCDLTGSPAQGCERFQTELLAENYRRIKVFFCLPPLYQGLVCKIFEVMACGTFVMAPRLEGEGAKNLSVFEDRKHLVYYSMNDFVENASEIFYWLSHDEERNAVAAAGQERVHERHTLKGMLEQILQPVCVAA